MKNLLIRLLSFIICLGLLAGGAILSFILTMENEDLMKSWQDVQEASWLPALENNSEGEQAPEGGEQPPEGGEQTPEGGEQTPEGGEQTPEGGEQTPEGNDPVTE